LCGGWDAQDLLAHLVVRERRPIASLGNVVGPLGGLTERAMARQRTAGFEVLVERFRTPAPFLRLVPAIDEAMNTFELLVHHEDLRRGGPRWEPREQAPSDVDLLWKQLGRSVALLGRKLPVPTVLERSDTRARIVAKKGAAPATVTGPVVELVLFLFGRSSTRDLVLDGPDEAVAALRSAELGI
ncbi:MAG: TIGR03085 family metal-binding protein, partial [Nocardioides sp.]